MGILQDIVDKTPEFRPVVDTSAPLRQLSGRFTRPSNSLSSLTAWLIRSADGSKAVCRSFRLPCLAKDAAYQRHPGALRVLCCNDPRPSKAQTERLSLDMEWLT